MLQISIRGLTLDLRSQVYTPSVNNPTPSMAALISPEAGSRAMGGPLADIPQASSRGCPEGRGAPGELGEARARAALPIAAGSAGDMLPPTDGVGGSG